MNLPVSTIRRICNKVVAVNVSPLMANKYKMNIVSIAMMSGQPAPWLLYGAGAFLALILTMVVVIP